MSTIAAIATPSGKGGMAVIRISGDKAISIAKKVFVPFNRNIDSMKGYEACYGNIFNEEKKLDDGVLLIFKAPHSYTGEDVVEISCHGGELVSKEVLQSCINSGAIHAGRGEFTKERC